MDNFPPLSRRKILADNDGSPTFLLGPGNNKFKFKKWNILFIVQPSTKKF